MTSIPPSLCTSRSRSSLSTHSVADTVTSTAPLTAAYRPPPKDYAAAFASLQGQYGMSGDFPVHASAPVKKKPRKPPPRPRSGSAAGPSTPTPGPGPKNVSLQHRARTPDPPIAASRGTSPDSGRVRAPAETSSAMPDPGLERTEGDKGKSSGLSRLRKLFRLRRKEPRES
ncbi:hypothetical protein DFH06DRAFT_1141842 [Mycena polygramma]|nr:hypothetical protein DFH06DRAFT_1141842 [Mycena polygramma]